MDVNLEEMFGGTTQTVAAEVSEPEVVEAEVVETPKVEIPVQEIKPQQVVKTQKTEVKANSAVSDDFSIDMPESLTNSLADVGIEVGEMGMKVSRVPIEKYKASASKVDRIGFITRKVIPVKFHYIENVGSILCNGSKCCEVAGSPALRYLFPIVEYQTDTEGNVSGGKVSLKMLSAGEDLYKSIMTIDKGSASMGGIDKVDLLVTCTDEHYQKITLVQAGPALWRQYSQIAEYLRDKWLQDGDKSYMAVARKVDNETLMKLLDMDDGGEAQTVDLSQNQDLSKFFS